MTVLVVLIIAGSASKGSTKVTTFAEKLKIEERFVILQTGVFVIFSQK